MRRAACQSSCSRRRLLLRWIFWRRRGFVIITLLSLFGFQDMNEINALKVVSTTMANGIAFLIFVFDGQVVWRYCLLAMITAHGGYTSARFARMIPQKILRRASCFIGFPCPHGSSGKFHKAAVIHRSGQ